MRQFGSKLRALRESRGMTLMELAQALGYPVSNNSYISQVETGKRVPKADFILKVATFFGVSADQLMRDDLEV
ncbi:MAG: helix-turn-helix transcriptional regulator [Chloroflexaceae bacterium]|nr:helix-turn-helix transcriptional regulator [Chloroflexaceae bacterium]